MPAENWVVLTPKGNNPQTVDEARGIADTLREELGDRYPDVEVREGMEKSLELLTWLAITIGQGAIQEAGAWLARRILQLIAESGGKLGARFTVPAKRAGFELPRERVALARFYLGFHIDILA